MNRYPSEFRSRIGGVDCGQAFASIHSPFDGSEVGRVAVADGEDMNRAIIAAHRAFEDTRALPTHERVALLTAVARAVEDEAADLAQLMAMESGKPITLCRSEVGRAVLTLELGAEEARRLGGELIPLDLSPQTEGRLGLWKRVPRGPVAAIAPFNFPLNLAAHKLAPASAVGASCVLKPAPQCPLTGHRLVQIFDECGALPGMVNVLHTSPEIAQRMVEDERMKVLSFTGSDAVGWKLKSLAGKKQVILELGGNAPCVIDESVSLDSLMERVVVGAWANAGQVCIKVQRILVHRSHFDEFLAGFISRTEALKCGDPLDPEVTVGPLIDSSHTARVLEWIAEARGAGAVVHTGGDADGNVVRPTILTGARPELRIVKDEVFGPVTVVESFDDFDDALSRCNQTRYGLHAGVFTRHIDRAMRAFEVLDYGGVMINDIPTFRVDNMPYGGSGDSGFGREGVRFAMEEMTEQKMLVMRGL